MDNPELLKMQRGLRRAKEKVTNPWLCLNCPLVCYTMSQQLFSVVLEIPAKIFQLLYNARKTYHTVGNTKTRSQKLRADSANYC